MADNLNIPRRFIIGNKGKVGSAQRGPACSRISFTPGPKTTWSAIHMEGKFYGFQQSETGYWATAVNGQILTCPDFNKQQQSSFFIVDNRDGTYLIQLNTANAIWTVKPDGSLALGPVVSNPETVFRFLPAQ